MKHTRSLLLAAGTALAAGAGPEQQALVPMFGEAPVELGLAGMEQTLIDRIRAEPAYARLFAEAFPDLADPVATRSSRRSPRSTARSYPTDRPTIAWSWATMAR